MLASKVYLFAALPLLLQSGIGMASPTSQPAKSMGKRSNIIDVTLTAAVDIDLSDTEYSTNEQCDINKDYIRCVNGDSADLAQAQWCADIPGDGEGAYWWKVPQDALDCGVRRTEDDDDDDD